MIFHNVVGDILKWVVLNAIIIIPFACAFWIEFGLHSETPAEGYTDVSSLLYNVFQMMIVGNYGWNELVEKDKTMARILCGSFTLVAGIITLNLLIALVTNTFERHYENAIANAVMQRASTILLLQSRMGRRTRKKYFQFIRTNASPQIIQAKHGRFTASPEDRVSLERVHDDVQRIKIILDERFGRRYGKGTKSDLEVVCEDLGKVKKSGKEMTREVKNLKSLLYDTRWKNVVLAKKAQANSTGVTAGEKDTKDGDEDEKYNNNNNNSSSKNNRTRAISPTRPAKTKKRNQSRRGKTFEPSTSETSESDDASMTGQLSGTYFPSRKRRYYADDVDWPRRQGRPSNGKSRDKRFVGKIS